MTPLETAILRTVLYADVFNFALTREEIHHFLIHDCPVLRETVNQTLETSPMLRDCLYVGERYIACRRELVGLRVQREQASRRLWPLAMRYGAWLGRLPFVRMVALTGALAMRNVADGDDDLDYLIVTASDRVWVARAFAILLVRLLKWRGVVICPNYVLAEHALVQDRQDLFVAHEVAQMIPVFGDTIYWQFREENRWVAAYLPNAPAPFYAGDDGHVGSVGRVMKRFIEFLLGGGIGDRLEQWEYRRKAARFSSAMQSPGSAAQIDRHHVKGHFNDYGHPALRRYHERLRAYGLDDADGIVATGD